MRAGQTVTDGDGLVGRVLHADASTAVVLLAADPGSGVGVRDLRTGQLGVVTGAGRDGFTVPPAGPDARRCRSATALATGPAGASSYVAGLVDRARSPRCAPSADGTTVARRRPDRVGRPRSTWSA